MKKHILILIAIFATSIAQAQFLRNDILQDKNKAGCEFYTYSAPQNYTQTPVPSGYSPFYISHYGRHGSRWHASEKMYLQPLEKLANAADYDALTDVGKSLYTRVQQIAKDAKDRYGDLTPRGAEEHRGIAERMYKSFPQIFSDKNCRVQCRSTVIPRVILSMVNFCDRLKELNTKIKITREASQKYEKYLTCNTYQYDIRKDSKAFDEYKKHFIKSERFINNIFSDNNFFENEKQKREFMYQIFLLAIDIQCVDYMNIALYDVFTDDEIYNLYQLHNIMNYVNFGPSPMHAKYNIENAKLLMNNVLTSADDAIKNKNINATLRFGHDKNLMAFLDLLGINFIEEDNMEKLAEQWSTSQISPMAANVQFVFYKNTQNNIILKVLLNEKEVRLPMPTTIFPFYEWTDFKEYYQKIIDTEFVENKDAA